MTEPTWERISDIFNDALDLDPAARSEFLDNACAGDDALRREIDSMLSAHGEDARMRVEDRLLSDAAPAGVSDALAGTRVGAYRLERMIGRGGMGDVYLAQRDDDQYQHRVALKLIQPGLHGQEINARFLQERQILAQLEHPNIASLIDGGVHDDGRPYLVMQYVDGVPITDYCKLHALSIRQCLELFRTVCHAVHVAHVNLVVHRDLKPANILVTADGTVKLLDFGIAKILDPSAPSATRSLVLTPGHAAPEQITGQAITTATDVYALGVLLYQLLTGERPLDIPTTSAGEMERVIREIEPAPPSSRAGRHARTLRGDLDHIVLMALRKEPERRYQSALEFGEDVGRYLDGMAVHAQPSSVSYRARKFVTRHRAGVAFATVVALLAASLIATAVRQSRNIARERDRARVEQAKAERVVDVLTGLLSRANPNTTPGGDTLRVSHLIDQIELEVAAMDDQPMVQARIWEMLAGIHSARSGYSKSEKFLRQALAVYQEDPILALETARVQHGLAMLTLQTHGPVQAEPLLRASLARHRSLLGNFHRDVGVALQDLAGAVIEDDPDEAMALLKEAMVIARAHGETQPMGMAAIYNHLGTYYLQHRDHVTAMDNFNEALVILKANVGEDHPYVLTVTHNVAACMLGLGQWQQAEALQRKLIVAKQRVLGPDTQPVGQSWEAIAGALANQGKLDEAADAYQESLRIFAARLGEDSGFTANALRNVAMMHYMQNRSDQALALLDRSLATGDRNGTGDTRAVAFERVQRALVLFATGQHEQAIAEGRIALDDVDRLALDASDEYRADARSMLATMLIAVGEYADAERRLREAVEIQAAILPPTSAKLACCRCLLGAALALGGDEPTGEAHQLLEQNYSTISSWGLIDPVQRRILAEARAAAGLANR